jgi:starvation-inducible DNA-binding protein
MEQLIEKLKALHATNFAFYLKLHFFHWNVEGPNFPQYHELFGKLYEDVFGSVDVYAESIRALEAYAPGSFTRFSALSAIGDQVDPVSAEEMLAMAMDDNRKLMFMIRDVSKIAEDMGEVGITNFLEGRFEIHRKHQWMLRATSKV